MPFLKRELNNARISQEKAKGSVREVEDVGVNSVIKAQHGYDSWVGGGNPENIWKKWS